MIGQTALGFLCMSVLVWLLPIDGELGELLPYGMFFVAFAVGAVWYLSTPTAAHCAEDVLGAQFGSYYEADGLCFVPEFVVLDGLCWVNVFYQNRYNAGCSSRVYLFPMEGWSPKGLNDVPAVFAAIECGGGDVGVLHLPYPIARSWQGKIMIYDVMGATTYPAGRGELVRSEGGLLVDPPPLAKPAVQETLEAAALLLVGFVRVSSEGRRGKIEMTLPEDVADAIPPGVVAHRRTIATWIRRQVVFQFPEFVFRSPPGATSSSLPACRG